MIMMNLLLKIFVISIVSSSSAAESVKMTVYYESLCPDSQYFIATQLHPVWELFGSEELNLIFNPFGKANFTEWDSSWNFTCQHGPRECEGNKIQSCVLNQVTDAYSNCQNVHIFKKIFLVSFS